MHGGGQGFESPGSTLKYAILEEKFEPKKSTEIRLGPF